MIVAKNHSEILFFHVTPASCESDFMHLTTFHMWIVLKKLRNNTLVTRLFSEKSKYQWSLILSSYHATDSLLEPSPIFTKLTEILIIDDKSKFA
jgi:hypothetical protein